MAKTDWTILETVKPDDMNQIGKEINEKETPSGAQEKVDAHAHQKNNPHRTTKTHVGLGNVDNIEQASKVEFDKHVSDKNNPHNVTSSQVNLLDTGIDANIVPSDYPKGIFGFYCSGKEDSNSYEVFESYMNSIGITPEDFGRQSSNLRAYVYFVSDTNGTSIITFTLFDSAAANDYKIYAIYDRASNYPTRWGNWSERETTEGAQDKADKALDDSIKYTNDNAQMHKITADNGSHYLTIRSGTIIDALQDYNSVTFYYGKDVTDKPGVYTGRGIKFVGQSGIGTIIVIDTENKAWWGYYSVNDSEIKWSEIADKDYVNERFIFKTGGSMSGPLHFRPSAGGGSAYLSIYENGDIVSLGTGSYAVLKVNGYDIESMFSKSNWLKAALQNGWTHANGREVFYKKSGNLLCIKGVTSNPGSTTATIFTLPADYRPSQAKVIPVSAISKNVYVPGNVQSSRTNRLVISETGAVSVLELDNNLSNWSMDLIVSLD